MLRGEMAFGLGVFEPKATLATYRTNVFPQPDPATRWWEPDEIAERALFSTYIAVANDAADQLHLVRSFSTFCAASAVPPPRRMAAMSNASWHATSRPGTERYLFSQRLLPIFVNVVARDLQGLARTRTFRVALALEHFRIDSGGTVPGSQAVLVPEYLAAVPADPFTGQPLRYIRNGRGYVVYSVGENLTDEQGAPKSNVPFIVEK